MKKYFSITLILTTVLFSTGCKRDIDFGSLSLGDTFAVGDSFSDNGVNMQLETLLLSDDTVIDNGSATVVKDRCDWGNTGGNQLELSNSVLNIDLPTSTGYLIYFCHEGGGVNVSINGQFSLVDAFSELKAVEIDGLSIKCFNNCDANGMGALKILGEINSFSLGAESVVVGRVTQILY